LLFAQQKLHVLERNSILFFVVVLSLLKIAKTKTPIVFAQNATKQLRKFIVPRPYREARVRKARVNKIKSLLEHKSKLFAPAPIPRTRS